MRFVQFLFFKHTLVRGATQREVKLEITGNQNEELIKYLDDIFLGLRYQDGHYDLVKLNDEEYLEKLQMEPLELRYEDGQDPRTGCSGRCRRLLSSHQDHSRRQH